jgi:hypothetical protein
MKDEEIKTKVRCLCCDKELEATSLSENEPPCMINDGVKCYTHGNYGSTVFDPVYGDYRLVFYICDLCISSRKDKILHVQYKQQTVVQILNDWCRF